MGTRGCYGFRINKEKHLTFNHWASGPFGLGLTIVKFIQDVNRLNEERFLIET